MLHYALATPATLRQSVKLTMVLAGAFYGGSMLDHLVELLSSDVAVAIVNYISLTSVIARALKSLISKLRKNPRV